MCDAVPVLSTTLIIIDVGTVHNNVVLFPEPVAGNVMPSRPDLGNQLHWGDMHGFYLKQKQSTHRFNWGKKITAMRWLAG